MGNGWQLWSGGECRNEIAKTDGPFCEPLFQTTESNPDRFLDSGSGRGCFSLDRFLFPSRSPPQTGHGQTVPHQKAAGRPSALRDPPI